MIPFWLQKIRYGTAQLYEKSCTLISPPYCIECHDFLDERIPLCTRCEKQLEPIVSLEMKITTTYSIRIFALTKHTGIIRKLTLGKYYGQPLASRQLGELMSRGCYCPWDTFDVLVPVPLHWSRYTTRGFNQAAEIAYRISELRNIPVDQIIKRHRRTPFQAKLSAEQRQSNVSKSFILRADAPERYHNKHIVIIDDVMTTGATLQEIAHTLLPCKPASLTALVGTRAL